LNSRARQRDLVGLSELSRREFAVRSHNIVFFVALLLGTAPAWAHAAPQPASCGASVAENLAAAQKALAGNNTALRPALTCLIEATNDLDKRLKAVEGQKTGTLTAPVVTTPCNWAGANGCR
jgi:hypothetical protein